MSSIPKGMLNLGLFGSDNDEPKKIVIPKNIDIKDSLYDQEWCAKGAQLVVE